MNFLRRIIYLIFIITYLIINIPGHQAHLKFDKIYNYDQITNFLHNLAERYPNIIQITSIGSTHEGREIYAAYISRNTTAITEKPMILIDGGIHGREWRSPLTVLYLIQQMVENKNYYYMHRSVDWFIIPVLNPDGYVYSLTTDNMWRKNRRKGKECDGVDLNRNFDCHWMESDASNDECSNTYAGPYASSEPEVRALQEVMLRYRHRIKVYVTVHSSADCIIYPFGTTVETPNEKYHIEITDMMASAMGAVRGRKLKTGNIKKVLKKITGTSADWAVAEAKIPIALTMELPPGYFYYGLLKSEIIPLCKEMFEGYKAIHQFVIRRVGQI